MMNFIPSSTCRIISQLRRPVLTNTRSFAVSFNTVEMPSLSPTMTHGNLASWKVKPGDEIKPGDVICEIETDKAVLGFEFQDEGVLAKILVDANTQDVKCGSPIAITVDDLDAYNEFIKSPPELNLTSSSAAAAPVASNTASQPSAPVCTSTTTSAGQQKFSPAARFIAQSYHLNVDNIKGTGKGGMISKGDLTSLIKNLPAPTPKPAAIVTNTTPTSQTPTQSATTNTASFIPNRGQAPSDAPVNDSFTDIPNSNMRKVIAKRLTESKTTVPHAYSIIECDLESVMKLRKLYKTKYDTNISVNDVIIKACSLALKDVPEANSKWDPVAKKIVFNKDVDISVAVATPTGLITPIITNANTRGIVDINNTVKDLANRAKVGKLKPEEYQGGSFSISNLGMFGVSHFSAVINPPQACILAVGSGVPRVFPPLKAGDKPRIVTTLTVQLSSDRRVVDEEIASKFLQVFKAYINDTQAMLM